MTAIPKEDWISPKDYLTAEDAAEFRSEYVAGEVFAMAGGSRAHNLICTNLVGELHSQLKGKRCDLYTSEMKIWLDLAETYAYPDTAALCGDTQFHEERTDIITNPSFIAEVLSDSTETYDRGNKFKGYASLASLREYLLISQHEMEIETRIRQDDNSWRLETFTDPSAVISLPSIGCELRLGDLYDKVELDQNP